LELIAVLLTIFLISTLLAWITKVNIAYLYAPSIFLIVLWEYLFGFIGYLSLGMETLVTAICSSTLILLIKRIDFRTLFIKNLYSPSTVAFILLAAVSFQKTKGWMVYQWDEFTHWGHVVKIMYKYAEFGPSTPTDYTPEHYPPGIGLFQYFVMDFGAGWREGMLYWSAHLIILSLIVSVLANCSYKFFIEIILKLCVALIASLALFTDTYFTITADPILALAFGYLILIAVNTSYRGGRWIIIFAATAGFLTLVKPIAIYFACAAILINIIATLFTVKFDSLRKIMWSFLPATVALVTVGTVWATWGRYIARLSDPNSNNINVTIPTELRGFADASFVSELTSKFIEATFGAILNPASWLAMPASSWTVVCIIFFTFWTYLSGKTNFARNIAIGVTLLVTTFGYLVIILYSYLAVFSSSEAAALASFPRYVATWYHGVFFAIVLLILSEVDFGVYVKSNQFDAKPSGLIDRQKHIGVLLVAFIALNTISSLGYYVFMLRSSPTLGIEWREPLFKTSKAIKAAKIPDGSKVYIVTQHRAGFEYYLLRYEMVGAQFGEMPFSIGTKKDEGDIWTEEAMDAKKWSEALQNFDFVVLSITTEGFNDEFASLFKDGLVEADSVYKVTKNQNRVLLVKVA